jgi:hypothetical protein
MMGKYLGSGINLKGMAMKPEYEALLYVFKCIALCLCVGGVFALLINTIGLGYTLSIFLFAGLVYMTKMMYDIKLEEIKIQRTRL